MSAFALTTLLLSIALWISYVGFIYIKYRPDCISLSYYLLKNGNIFTYWIIVVSFLVFPAWVELSPIWCLFLPFLSVVSLSCVGICPKYLESDRVAHISSAAITFIISLIWNIVTGLYWIPIILGIILILLYFTPLKDKLFWTECAAFINIYLSVFLI